MPHAPHSKSQNIKQEQYHKKCNKNLKNGPRQKNLFKKIRSGSKIYLNVYAREYLRKGFKKAENKDKDRGKGELYESVDCNSGSQIKLNSDQNKRKIKRAVSC